jgi:uncharacterized protein YukE
MYFSGRSSIEYNSQTSLTILKISAMRTSIFTLTALMIFVCCQFTASAQQTIVQKVTNTAEATKTTLENAKDLSDKTTTTVNTIVGTNSELQKIAQKPAGRKFMRFLDKAADVVNSAVEVSQKVQNAEQVASTTFKKTNTEPIQINIGKTQR